MLGTTFKKSIVIAAMCLSATHANAAFDLKLTFDSSVSEAYKQYFTIAENFWESIITGYQTGISLTGLSILVSTPYIDGISGVLGGGGPEEGEAEGGFALATSGSMKFDSADVNGMISNKTFANVIEHEMAHVIGFGTLWADNNVYVNGSGQYTGANALAAYKTEFNQPNATYVPVELGGSSGTNDGHWNEVNGGAGATGILAAGQDMEYELMTGWLNAPTFISRTTIASFADIGYTISAVPEPETVLMYAIGLPFLLRIGARRRAQATYRR